MSAISALAWAFQTNQTAQIKSSPLLVDGILYFTVPDNVWAVDARSGHMIWHYHRLADAGRSHRPSRRGHVQRLALLHHAGLPPDLAQRQRRQGALGQSHRRRQQGLLDDHGAAGRSRTTCIVGVSGDFDNLPGYLRSFDPETGATQWQWDATPPAGTPNATTGGMTWMTGTYDPGLESHLLGNRQSHAGAEWQHAARRQSLHLQHRRASIPTTESLPGAFQASPHDTHDWDAVETPVLVDRDFHGQPRKMLMQTSRNGYFFVLDRTNGKNLLTVPFGPVNWALGIDKEGRPIPNPDKEPAPDGRLIAPDEGGVTNYRSPSFDPKTGLFIVDAHPSWSIYFAKPADGVYGWAGADYDVWGKERDRGHRLSDRQDSLEPRSGCGRFRRRRDDHRFRPDHHRRRLRQRAGARHQQRQDAVARGHGLADAELSHQLRARRTPVHRDQQRRRAVCVGAAGIASFRRPQYEQGR